MVGTTDAIESDVTQPGRPAASTQVASAPQPRQKADTTRSQKPPKTTPAVAYRETTQPEPKPSPPAQASSTSTAFPTAKAVPDKLFSLIALRNAMWGNSNEQPTEQRINRRSRRNWHKIR